MGDAVYCWSEINNIKWMGNLDLHYFHGKCVASEVGRPFDGWDIRRALNNIESYVKGNYDEPSKIMKNFEEYGGRGSLYDKEEWYQWLRENGDEVFEDDWYEWAPGVGRVVNLRCEAHWLGLKMAMEQLKGKEDDKKDS